MKKLLLLASALTVPVSAQTPPNTPASQVIYLDGKNGEDEAVQRTTYVSITYFGGDPSALDNKNAFNLADAKLQPVYVPNGEFKSSSIPAGQYLGTGTIKVGTEIFRLGSVPAYLRAPITTGLDKRQNSLIIGQGAGRSLDIGSANGVSANVVVGPYAVELGVDTSKVTCVGWSCGQSTISGGTFDGFGAAVLQQSTYADRVVALGANAGKWAGSSNPKAALHDFFQPDWGGADDRDIAWPSDGPDRGWRSVVQDSAGNSLVNADTPDDNEQNLYIGRDTGIHAVVGRHNDASGVHAFEGWNASEVTSSGWESCA